MNLPIEKFREIYEMVMVIYRHLDKKTSEWRSSGKLQDSCQGAGCNYCCYEAVEISPVEVPTIHMGIMKLSAEDQLRVSDNWARWKMYLGGMRPLSDKNNPPPSLTQLRAKTHKLAWKNNVPDKMRKLAWKHNVPCPLLLDGKCSIYEHRPANCRNYFAQNGPELCKDGEAGTIRMTGFWEIATDLAPGLNLNPSDLLYPLGTLVEVVEAVLSHLNEEKNNE